MGKVEATGDWDLRGLDFETQLVGPITDAIIDADRLVRLDHNNGIPNFFLYRLVLCGDKSYMGAVRQWWQLFALTYCREEMRGAYSEELAVVAAWDSLQRLCEPARPLLNSGETAADLGVSLPTYLSIRNSLLAILQAALNVYWIWLTGTYRIVKALERRV